MNNKIGKFNGAESIQRMRAQQQNAPQVNGQESENPQTIRKPLSKSEVADMVKGSAAGLGERTNNKDNVGGTQYVDMGDGTNNNSGNTYTANALKNMGFTDSEIEKWFIKSGNGKYKMRDDITYEYGKPRNRQTGTVKTLDELKERMGIDIRNQMCAETGYPAELFELAYRPFMDLLNGKVETFVLKEGVQLDDQMYGNNRVLTLTNEDTSKNIFIIKEDGSTYEVKLGESWAHVMANRDPIQVTDINPLQTIVDKVEVGLGELRADPLAQYEGVTEITDVQELYDIGFNEEEIAEYFDKVETEDGGVKFVMKAKGFPGGRAGAFPYIYGENVDPKSIYFIIPQDLAELIKITGVDDRKSILSRFPEGMFEDCYTKYVNNGDAHYECKYGYNKVTTAPDGKQIVTFYNPLINDVYGIAIYNPEDGSYEWIIDPRENQE